MIDDAALVRRVLEGDAAAYEQLVARHTQAVRAVALALGGDWEDVVQETFLRGYGQLRTLYDPAKFREWIFGIARNVCRDEAKRRAKSKRPGPRGRRTADPVDDRIAALRQAVDRLPDDYRVVIEMRHFEQLSYEEIGERLGLGRNGVNARLTRARAMLREKLGKNDGVSA